MIQCQYLFLTRNPLGRHYHYPHLPDDETEAQRLNHFSNVTKWWREAEIQAQAVQRRGPAPNLYTMVRFQMVLRWFWDVAAVYVILHACTLSYFSHARLFVTLWTIAHQAPLSMEFSRQEGKSTGVGCHALLQGNLPNPGIKPASLMSPALAGSLFTTSANWEALMW